ncbi:hypothetical protein V8C43DRAFT_329292 [Trichoderma afarasin]
MRHGPWRFLTRVLACACYVLVRVELGIAILRATVLRTPSTGLHCFFKIRLSKCRGLWTHPFPRTCCIFRNAWCRHLYMATMASPVPVRSASIADGPLASPSGVVTGDNEFQFLRRMTTHPNSTIAPEVFEIAAQTVFSCLSHEPPLQAQIHCRLGKENGHPPVTTGLRMPSVVSFQPTPSK